MCPGDPALDEGGPGPERLLRMDAEHEAMQAALLEPQQRLDVDLLRRALDVPPDGLVQRVPARLDARLPEAVRSGRDRRHAEEDVAPLRLLANHDLLTGLAVRDAAAEGD